MSEHEPAPGRHASDALPGTRLKLERGHQGLSRDEVATQLNLRPSLVDDLERDHYDRLPIA
ncbi:helix-turn-helix domain-containing protein, partial [Cobetia sp. SIMBA_158]|uniref:helix-turn-helix domain-containing protein n=1 Tax=Cobetia sp. SIMBA_158 TaxID=3081617 RepID=UPI0039816829